MTIITCTRSYVLRCFYAFWHGKSFEQHQQRQQRGAARCRCTPSCSGPVRAVRSAQSAVLRRIADSIADTGGAARCRCTPCCHRCSCSTTRDGALTDADRSTTRDGAVVPYAPLLVMELTVSCQRS